jgi:hypothetical protein
MEEEKKLTITKLDAPSLVSTHVAGKKNKTLKTFPRGIMKTSKSKIKATNDPAKHPSLKKSMKKHTIKLLTDSAVNNRRKTIKKRLDKLSDDRIREIAMKTGLSKGNAPSPLVRQIVEGGVIAGFISLP